MINVIIGLLITLCVLVILYLFAICPRASRDRSNFDGRFYAHRGLHNASLGVPENSLAAFKLARQNGYGVELDVQITADGKVVVFHDGDLKRMCGVDANVYALTYDELCRYTLLDTQEKIPLFSEVLDVLGDTHIVCEIKTPRSNSDLSVCFPVYEMIKDKPNICMESFNPFAVQWFKKFHPEIIRGQLSQNFVKNGHGMSLLIRILLTNLMLNFLAKPDFIAFRHEDRELFTFRLCARLFKPLRMAWTVRSMEDQEKIRDDFDAVIFENYMAE